MIKLKNRFLAIGLMSGTSLDGVDVAIVEYQKNEYKLKYFSSRAYSDDLKKRILKNSNRLTSDVQSICGLNVEIAQNYIWAIEDALLASGIKQDEISFIASHGQTIWHNPHEMDQHASSTLQIGDPNLLAHHFNVPIIYDFRLMDMAAGGTGAPLIPFIDHLLFAKDKEAIYLTNIGGISNVTYLGPNSDVYAFDTGPGNMWIDGAMRMLYDKAYDDKGRIAKSGQVNPKIIDRLFDDEYFSLKPPKSTGREKYNDEALKELIDWALRLDGIKKEDIITSLSSFTVLSILHQVDAFLPRGDKMIVSGGGCNNDYLMEELKKKAKFPIYRSDDFGINSDAKEAMGFMILGHMRILGRPSNVPSVTGAKQAVSLGCIALPPIK